jgi:hypothetical protein
VSGDAAPFRRGGILVNAMSRPQQGLRHAADWRGLARETARCAGIFAPDRHRGATARRCFRVGMVNAIQGYVQVYSSLHIS